MLNDDYLISNIDYWYCHKEPWYCLYIHRWHNHAIFDIAFLSINTFQVNL